MRNAGSSRSFADTPAAATPGAKLALWPGEPWPLGARVREGGVNFAVFGRNAGAVDLCLFDEAQGHEFMRLRMPEQTDGVWHGFLPGAGAGVLYGYRAHGPFEPRHGHRFNPAKLLIDPYAKAWAGRFSYDEALLGPTWRVGHPDPDADLVLDERDNAGSTVRCRVVADPSPYHGPRPDVPWRDTLIYEAHVKGLTKRHPKVPADRRGTAAALSHPAVLDHLVRLGVTAVELLPLQALFDEPRLVRMGLTNHWGYNPLGFFVPEPRYLANRTVPDGGLAEVRTAVRALHSAGIEAILDVVYNHTGEGDRYGPTLSFRGLDNASYYRLEDGGRGYQNFTGCGNTLDFREPAVLKLCTDSLRYWVETLGFDGFRFDLAPAMGRESDGFDPGSGFFDALAQDPVLSTVKLIAEPWDVGPNGYQLGNHPAPFAEWNDKARDGIRAFWRGEGDSFGGLAEALAGSPGLFSRSSRGVKAGVNFVAAHDGFTLWDAVSYERKHNQANGEHNRDGHGHNLSSNGGIEGRTDDARVLERRFRRRRNLAVTLLLARGTPMWLAGDEIGRTQEGNNNAYCQDNEVSWLDWGGTDEAWLGEARALLALRRRHPVFKRRGFGPGPGNNGAAGEASMTWLDVNAAPVAAHDLGQPHRRAAALLFDGRASPDLDREGRAMLDDSFVLLINGQGRAQNFLLPEPPSAPWAMVLNTAERLDAGERPLPSGRLLSVEADSAALLRSAAGT